MIHDYFMMPSSLLRCLCVFVISYFSFFLISTPRYNVSIVSIDGGWLEFV